MPWSQRVRGLRRLVLPSLVREAGPGVRSFWAGPAFLGHRCLLSALCGGERTASVSAFPWGAFRPCGIGNPLSVFV